MERLDPELLKMVADALHETMQCPVCLASLRPPVTLCVSGHGICPDCKPRVNNCPTCRESFSTTSPILLHQLLDALPRSCQFKLLGCTDVYVPGNKHEESCSFRSLECKVTSCNWNGQSRKLLDHLTSTHADLTYTLLDETWTEIRWDMFDSSQDCFKYVPIVAYNQVFWQSVHMNTDVKKLCISFTYVCNGDSHCNYLAVIRFKKDYVEYAYTIKIPEDNNLMFDFYEEFCMTIPGNMISRFVENESLLKYNVCVIREDK